MINDTVRTLINIFDSGYFIIVQDDKNVYRFSNRSRLEQDGRELLDREVKDYLVYNSKFTRHLRIYI